MHAAQALPSHRFRSTQAVTKTDRAKGVFVTYLILLILLAFTCCLFYIWSRIQIVNVGYDINREVSAREKLIEENKRLTMEVATLKSPVRLESLAKNEYRMDLPQKSQILSEGPFLLSEPQKIATTKPDTLKKTAPLKLPAKTPPSKTLASSPKKTASPSVAKTTAVTPLPLKKEFVKKEAISKKPVAAPSKPTEAKMNPQAKGLKLSPPKVASAASERPPH